VLFTMSTERITGNENWLIAHEYGNNNFRAYPITATGLGTPVISSIGSDHSLAVAENAQGYMKLGSTGILAVALSTPGVSNVVEIFDFDQGTGAVTNFRQIDLQQPAGQVYGIEFSSSGSKLYASTIGAGSALHEFAYDSVTSTYIKKPTIPVVPAATEIGAIQRGPDGNIYVAVNGSNSLGTIQENSDENTPSTFDPGGFPLAGGTSSTLGLPNFMQNIADPIQTPSISATGLCFGAPTDFLGSGTDPIDTLTWFFGDGQSQQGVNLTSVQHTYGAPGDYIVTLRISNRCVGFIDNLTDTVTIEPIPTALSGAITLCDGTEQIEATPATNPDLADLTFAWNTGDSIRAITPPGQGIYTVSVTSAAGCTADGEWFVADNRPQVEFGPDQTLCENTPAVILDAQNPGSSYEWKLNGTVVNTTDSVLIAGTGTPGIYKYSVLINDPFTGCTARDSVTLTINADAQFNESAIGPTACGAADGMIDVNITSNGFYYYTVDGPISAPTVLVGGDINGPAAIPTVTGLAAGAYNVMVTNQVTGCFERRTVGVNDQQSPFTVTIQRAALCNDLNNQMAIVINTAPDQSPFNWVLVTGTTTDERDRGTNSSNGVITQPVSNGSYAVEVTNAATGCVAVSPNTPISQDPPVAIDALVINPCVTPSSPMSISVTASAITWEFFGQNITSATTFNNTSGGAQETKTMTATPPEGQHNYRFKLTGAVGTCPNDTTVVVDVGAGAPAAFTQSNACDSLVLLSATPTGNYVYRWFNGPSAATATNLIPAGQTLQISTNQSGLFYIVEARNTSNGCTATSPAQQVAVVGVLTVDLTNEQPCEGTDFDIVADANQTPDSFTWMRNGLAVSGATGNTLTVTDDSDGLYKVRVQKTTVGQSCFAEDSVQVLVAPVDPPILPSQGIICPDEANTDPDTREVTLYPGEFLSYEWFRDGSPLNVTDTAYTATETGLYSVALVNSYGCNLNDQTQLIEDCDPKIAGPNAFRPDGSINKEFYLFTFFIADSPFEIFIFNRWGEMVYHSDQRDFRWNGGYNNREGAPLPPGTYTYVVKYKSSYQPEKGVQEHRGGVVLLR
jgi:large repetitive protein